MRLYAGAPRGSKQREHTTGEAQGLSTRSSGGLRPASRRSPRQRGAFSSLSWLFLAATAAACLCLFSFAASEAFLGGQQEQSLASKMKGDGVYDTFVWGQCKIQSLVEPGRLWRSSNARTTTYEVTGSPQEVTQALANLPAKLDRTLQNKFTKNVMRWR